MPRTNLATWARRLALFSAALILVALVLHRLGRIETPLAIGLVLTGFAGAGLALLSGVAAGVIIWRKGVAGAWSAAAGIVVSLAIFAWPASVAPFYLRLPPLSDVTTDFEQPPEFAVLARDRPKAANPVTYRGGLLAELQERHYPEVRPMVLDRAAEEVFDAVGEAARRLKWRIVSEEPPQEHGTAGYIEAEDRTLILGFVDDVIVRVESDGGTTRVDVRSLSRYGIHDFGRNASRIKEFYAELRARLEAAVPAAAAPRGKDKARGTKAPPRVPKGAPGRGQAPRK
ncbi:MAG: DUF1499 domain-containing protein [Hyphomicrobiaceae bacterium]